MTKPIARMGGQQFEGSPADKAQDRRGAKRAGMSMKAFEKSPADKMMDKAGAKRMNPGIGLAGDQFGGDMG